MTEKNGSTRLSALAAEAGTGQNKRSQQTMNENKPRLGDNKTDEERKAKPDEERKADMEPPRLSDLYKAPRGMLDRSLQAQLGRQLRAIFSDIAQEPVPERFVKLLEALEAREKRR